MTGAGSSTAVIGTESGFKSGVDADGFYHFGRNPSVTTLDLQNQLQRLSEAGAIQSVESVKGNFEGAFTVEATVNGGTHSKIKEIVFNDGGTGFTTGLAQSGEVVVGSEYIDPGASTTGEKLRSLRGVIPTDYELTYEQGGMVTYTLTMLYATEEDATAPSDVTTPTGGEDAAFHAVTLDIDGTTITDLQSATLSYSNLYRFQRGTPTEPIQAVLAKPEASLDVTAIFKGPDRQLDVAYGSQGATTPADRLSSVTGEFDITVNGTAVSTHTLPQLKPDTYSWSDLINDGDTDHTEDVSYHVNGQVSVA